MIDFLVIGGGIAGLSAGARLAHLGKVILLERETSLGTHSSGRSAACFEETYGAPSVVALNRASKTYLETANGGVLSPRGLLLVGSADKSTAFADDMVRMEMTPISMDDTLEMVPILNPDVVDRAAYHAGTMDIDTDLLMQNFAREIRANGGQIVTKAEVTGITRTATGWIVITPTATYDARQLVNAAGAWADLIAAMAGIAPIGLTPLRRSMARIPAPGGLDVSRWPMTFGPGEDWYVKPDAGALIVSPAEQDLTHPHDAYADDMVLAEGLARYEAHVTEPVTRMLANWAGLRTFAPDRQLVLGPSVQDATFTWCVGQGGYGFQTAPAASQLLADLVSGATPQMDAATIAATAPARFG
jgi:D-arginine dehydrogenase